MGLLPLERKKEEHTTSKQNFGILSKIIVNCEQSFPPRRGVRRKANRDSFLAPSSTAIPFHSILRCFTPTKKMLFQSRSSSISSISSTFSAAEGAKPQHRREAKEGNGQRKAPRDLCKGVRWSPKCTVRLIPSIDDLSTQEFSDLYYCQKDYKRIQDDVSEIIFLMKHTNLEVSEDVTFRGLEARKDGETKKKTKLLRFVVCRTIIAASRSSQLAVDSSADDETLGEMSRSMSLESKQKALQQASKDALDAKKAYYFSSLEVNDAGPRAKLSKGRGESRASQTSL